MRQIFCIISLFIAFCVFSLPKHVFAETVSQQIQDLEQKIADSKGKQDSLSNEISRLANQISLKVLNIESTKTTIAKLDNEITQLNDDIDRLEAQLTKRSELVLQRIPESYKRQSTSQFGMLFFSRDFGDFLSRVKYISTVQTQDAQLLLQLKKTQNNFGERKDRRELTKAKQVTYKTQLEKESRELQSLKQQQQALLAQTKGQESVYQQLLAQARAQLAGFASFSDSQGSSLLSGQTFCSDWGCYYNQRDSQWGSAIMNNRNDCGGPCSVARVGCLITSISMVVSHLGNRDILPVDIAFSSPSNYAVGTASLMKGTIYVKDRAITRVTVSGSLTPSVAQNGPVIVGVRYGPFGTHFVVVKSYDGGKYIMNDPYEANGHDISFTDRYSLGSVFEVDKVTIN
jgi:peptidoglycan hydrolase CwlO-like protein